MKYIYWSVIGGLIFTKYETKQIEFEGPRAYFKSIWNCTDFIGLTTYWVYVVLCFTNQKEEDFKSTNQIFMMTFIIICLFLKNCFFIRIFDIFALLVNLVFTCVVDIIPFCMFLFFWLCCYYLLFKVTGIESPDRTEIFGRHKNIQDTFYIWENSIGNIKYWGKTTNT